MSISTTIYLLCISIIIVNVSSRRVFVMDKHWLCNVKKSCMECLKMSHCSWCDTENKCFSRKLKTSGNFCQNSTIDHRDFGLSVEENSECSCGRGVVGRRCYPPGVTEGLECSGRGTCLCGRCVCTVVPEPEFPSKMVLGEYCEFDNFSCTGPKCNEGPYSFTDPGDSEDSSKNPEIEEVPHSLLNATN